MTPKNRENLKRSNENEPKNGDAPPTKNAKTEKPQFELPIEVVQTFQALCSPKPNRHGQPVRITGLKLENGDIIIPELCPLQQCQQLQQIQTMIQYHEQQVKYRSYMQLEVLRLVRKQLSDRMMFHPTRKDYESLLEAMKSNQLHPLSPAEKAQIEYFTSMADWTLEARAILQDKESPFYLYSFGRTVTEFKVRINQIVTHEQFEIFAPYFAERIDHHRELINTLNRRSLVSIG